MTNLRLVVLTSIAAAVLGTCVPPVPGSLAQTSPSADLVATLRADTAPDADSAAQRIRRGCPAGGEGRRTCVERALAAVLAGSGVARAMAVLDVLAAGNAELRQEAHALAHGLGIAAYRSPGTVAETFAGCPNTQISGCYHGVIQAYFLDVAGRGGEPNATAINELCEPHRGRGMLYFQCAHGMGHGLMALLDNHLPAALEHCDLAAVGAVRESCYGGAFMENIVAVTHPGHTAGGHAEVVGGPGAGDGEAGHGGHGADGHDGHAAAARPPWKPLDRSDPLYPCTVVAERYQLQCYLIQTAAILARNDGNVEATARACGGAPQRMVTVCYASLGRDLTSYAARDPRRTAALCARAGAAAEPQCIRGAATSLVDVSSDPEDGIALCRAVSGAALKTPCYQGVGGMLLTIAAEPAAREAVCAGVEEGFVAACRAGALLPVLPQGVAGR